jgi:hypothetical protein
LFAEYYVAVGRPEIGVAQLEQQVGEIGIETDPDSTEMETLFKLYALADGYEQLGLHERAATTRARGAEIADRLGEDDQFDSDQDALYTRAFVKGMSGNAVEGAALLDAAIVAGYGRILLPLTSDAMQSKAFQAPEFSRVIQRLEAILAGQREIVAAENKKNDFRAEFERMLAMQSQ